MTLHPRSLVLAGMIVERATGHRLGDELERRILAPLHLRDTSFPVKSTAIAGRHASGYAVVDGKALDVTVLDPSGSWAAGNLVSSAADIAHSWRALLGGKLLSPAQLKAMKTTVAMVKGSRSRYGLGIFTDPSECGTLWGNGGDIAGYNNRFRNSEDGTRQSGVMVNVNPMPEGLGEPLGQAKQVAISDALGSRELC
jgi:D-alanyl-D-alanine carboxypeptidase